MQNQNIIQVITKRGFTLNAFEGDSITQEVQKKGEYDTNTLNSLSEILAEIQPNISLDVGANIGNHAIIIAKYTKKVIAFEPVKFVYDVLQSNIKQNQIHNLVALNVGLSNKTAALEICIPPTANLGSASIENKVKDGTFLTINTIVGDDYLAQHFYHEKIDFIKIDVEGHEAMALLGLSKSIKENQPLILLEWKSPQTIEQFKELNLFKVLFSSYEKYSLSYTSNKKVHANASFGYLKRIYHKLIGSRWCLSSFDENICYSNVYLVPTKYQQYFNSLPYFD